MKYLQRKKRQRKFEKQFLFPHYSNRSGQESTCGQCVFIGSNKEGNNFYFCNGSIYMNGYTQILSGHPSFSLAVNTAKKLGYEVTDSSY